MRARELKSSAVGSLGVLASCVALAACGGTGTGGGKVAGRHGGTVTVLELHGVDGLDPGAWYYLTDYADLAQTTQRWLYGWGARSTAPVPDLALAAPRLSDGGRTLTIKIRSGVHYSPPLAARTVSSADIRYGIERCFMASVGNGYAFNYYRKIEGAPQEPVPAAPRIRGLQTPDARTLVIHTVEAIGVLDDGDALALPCTAPVPQSYAARFDAGAQSSYGMHALATGPYMVAGSGSGSVPASSYQPGRTLRLERNPSWSAASDPIRSAYFDRINFQGGFSKAVASREVLEGQAKLSGDYTAPPPAILHEALGSRRGQLQISPAGSTYFISLNSSLPPLDNVQVRRAIAAVIDRAALRQLFGGEALGQIATHFLPPGLPGFAQAGGALGAGYDFLASPHANLALARSYMRRAGFASGSYSGPPLQVVADNEAPGSEIAEALQQQLAPIGIRLQLHEVPHTTMLSRFCTLPKARVAICPSLSWEKDFLDAQSMIAPIFNGNLIQPQGNTDTSLADDPKLNAAIEAAERVVGAEKRARAWGDLDRAATGQAYVIPWLWANQVSFASADVEGATWPFNGGTWDLTASSLR